MKPYRLKQFAVRATVIAALIPFLAHAGFSIDSSWLRQETSVPEKSALAVSAEQEVATLKGRLDSAVIEWAKAMSTLNEVTARVDALRADIDRAKANMLAKQEAVEAERGQLREVQREQRQVAQMAVDGSVAVPLVAPVAPRPEPVMAVPHVEVTPPRLSVVPTAVDAPGVFGLDRSAKSAPAERFVLPKGSYDRGAFFKRILPKGYSAYYVRAERFQKRALERGYVAFYMGEGARFDRVVVADDVKRSWAEWLELAAKQTSTKFMVDAGKRQLVYRGVQNVLVAKAEKM